ncbi:MAG: exodeoxyribonuclease V subunit alpha [Bacillota bacterium]
MADRIRWTPSGSGAAIFEAAAGDRGDWPLLFAPLVTRAAQLDLGVEDVYLAWEITRLADDSLSTGEQKALLLLILAARAAAAEGSTRLPVEASGHLDRILAALSLSEDEHKDVDQLLRKAETAVASRESAESGSGLANIFGGPTDYRPLIFDHGYLYIQKLHVLEARVGQNLRERIGNGSDKTEKDRGRRRGTKPDPLIEKALAEVFATPPEGPFGKAELDDRQKEAVRTALAGRITVVSGRPGSGKTSIVATILRVLARLDSPSLGSIALAAPTGKAADRMRRAIADHLKAIPGAGEADHRLLEKSPPSLTLHRLLGYSPGQERFRHDEHNPLAEELVIVDESSMLDLALFDQLLRALRTEARVVFLGDADQLPPIGSGAVLRDLCRSKKAAAQGRVVILDKSYRAREEAAEGRSILEAAAAINRGLSPLKTESGEAAAIRVAVPELIFKGVKYLTPGNEEQKEEFFTRWYERLLEAPIDLKKYLSRTYISGSTGFTGEDAEALGELISYYESERILCVTRVTAGGTGSDEVNAWFHHRWLEENRLVERAAGNPRFLVGEPVLMTQNDYSLRLYNGDSGLILNVSTTAGARIRPAEPMALFPRGGSFAAFPLGTLYGRLEPAWATTVHKAQGSEYDRIAIILPAQPVRPLTRELLYTAVTRARRSVTFVGPVDALEWGAGRTMERDSGLVDMLDNA